MTGGATTGRDLMPLPHSALYWVLADTRVVAGRQLTRMRRVPDELVTTAIQPVLFVFLFRYVLGGAIAVQGTTYVNYLMPGVMVVAVIMGSAFTGIGMATDLRRGLVNRFRSLPMAGSAVLSGRILADLLRSAFVVLVVWVVGIVVGFQPSGSPLELLAAIGLLLLGSLTLVWFSALTGLLLSSVEGVQQAFVIWAMPLMFASSALVPTSTMVNWLRPFVEHQPVSVLIDAIRGLVLDQPDVTAVWQSLAWSIGLLAVVIPLAVWAYGRRITR